MPKRFSPEVREAFVEMLCGGSSLRKAAATTGVSAPQAVVWWRQCGHMSLCLLDGARGGLGPVPPDLLEATKVAFGVDRGLVDVVPGEAVDQSVEVVGVGRRTEVVCEVATPLGCPVHRD